MTITQNSVSVAEHQVISQQLASDLEKFLQSGGTVKQLQPCEHKGYNSEFNSPVRHAEFATVADRREAILQFIQHKQRVSCPVIAIELKIWQGNVATDLRVLVKEGLIYRMKDGNIFYYSVNNPDALIAAQTAKRAKEQAEQLSAQAASAYSEAVHSGAQYYNGKPCVCCASTLRYTSSKHCVIYARVKNNRKKAVCHAV